MDISPVNSVSFILYLWQWRQQKKMTLNMYTQQKALNLQDMAVLLVPHSTCIFNFPHKLQIY